jgi:hypothetical protein
MFGWPLEARHDREVAPPSNTSAGHHARHESQTTRRSPLRRDGASRESSSGPSLPKPRWTPTGAATRTPSGHNGKPRARRSVARRPPRPRSGPPRRIPGRCPGGIHQASRRGPSGGNGHPPNSPTLERNPVRRVRDRIGRSASARASGTPLLLVAETQHARVPIVPSGSEAHAMIQHERIPFNDVHRIEPVIRSPGYSRVGSTRPHPPYRTTDDRRPPPHPRSDPRAAASSPDAGVGPRS